MGIIWLHPFAPGTAAEPADQPARFIPGMVKMRALPARCVISAALGAPVLPPSPPVLEILAPVPVAPLALIRFAIAPGRGLAAPPPPATGPPPNHRLIPAVLPATSPYGGGRGAVMP